MMCDPASRIEMLFQGAIDYRHPKYAEPIRLLVNGAREELDALRKKANAHDAMLEAMYEAVMNLSVTRNGDMDVMGVASDLRAAIAIARGEE